MTRSKVALALAAAVVTAVGFIGTAMSQEATSRPGRGGGFDPAQFRQRMSDQMKQDLGATDEEWKALQPKIEKVQTLSRAARGGGMMGMMGGMGGRMGRGGRGGNQPAPEMPADAPETQKKMADLQKLIQNKDAKPEELKAAMTAYREAVTKAKEELAKAQKELKEVLTVRQEAVLLSRGLIE
ncbi:MAG: hypothetical protein ACE15C_04520 [Phycisphaerae bacterium]